MTDSERGNTTHGPRTDEQLAQESRGMVQGHGAPHAEPFRETEPLPDDTDAPDVDRAFRHETAPGAETEDGALEQAPVGDAPVADDVEPPRRGASEEDAPEDLLDDRGVEEGGADE
ncbi:hypothetical protein [Microbacterium sp. MEC084]|uniref:hypothetical protein n=1 Tax=Microbacterium sp. MEC084 TaxID=1963027 RepID=UPI00197BA4DF|nr:hypothetical protein [Microbacterium sp. MEC084]